MSTVPTYMFKTQMDGTQMDKVYPGLGREAVPADLWMVKQRAAKTEQSSQNARGFFTIAKWFAIVGGCVGAVGGYINGRITDAIGSSPGSVLLAAAMSLLMLAFLSMTLGLIEAHSKPRS